MSELRASALCILGAPSALAMHVSTARRKGAAGRDEPSSPTPKDLPDFQFQTSGARLSGTTTTARQSLSTKAPRLPASPVFAPSRLPVQSRYRVRGMRNRPKEHSRERSQLPLRAAASYVFSRNVKSVCSGSALRRTSS